MPLDDHALLLQLERTVESLTDASIDAIETVQQRIDLEVGNSPAWARVDDLETHVRELEALVQRLDEKVNRAVALVKQTLEMVAES